MPRMLRTLLLLAALAVPAAASAGHWDRFFGPNGTGNADDKDVPVTFDANTNVVWKIAVPGVGNSSPVVWDNRIYLQTAGADGKSRTLLAIDARDGQVAWKQSIPGVKV